MAQKRLAMSKSKTILRLYFLGGVVRSRQIAHGAGDGAAATHAAEIAQTQDGFDMSHGKPRLCHSLPPLR